MVRGRVTGLGFFNGVNELEVFERMWSSLKKAPKNRGIGGGRIEVEGGS